LPLPACSRAPSLPPVLAALPRSGAPSPSPRCASAFLTTQDGRAVVGCALNAECPRGCTLCCCLTPLYAPPAAPVEQLEALPGPVRVVGIYPGSARVGFAGADKAKLAGANGSGFDCFDGYRCVARAEECACPAPVAAGC
jgi:hypothetical protein